MNIEQSKKNIGKDFQFVPRPQSLTWTPAAVPIPDEFNRWRFQMVDRKQRVVRFLIRRDTLWQCHFSILLGMNPTGATS